MWCVVVCRVCPSVVFVFVLAIMTDPMTAEELKQTFGGDQPSLSPYSAPLSEAEVMATFSAPTSPTNVGGAGFVRTTNAAGIYHGSLATFNNRLVDRVFAFRSNSCSFSRHCSCLCTAS